MLLIVKLHDKYLKAVEGFQAQEWTRSVKTAMKFNGQGASYAHQIADTYGAQVMYYNQATGEVTPM